MKLILFYSHSFYFKTASRSLPDIPDDFREERVDKAVVVFFHVEAADEAQRSGVVRKFVKNVKWLCGKFATENVVLHSFNHLSSSKGTPEFSRELLTEVVGRLARAGYRVMSTPFGHFNEFDIHVAGDSLAKVYKEF